MIRQSALFSDWKVSVCNGKDADALNILIPLHAASDNPSILDCTFGNGKMWQGSQYQPDFTTDKRPLGMATALFEQLPFANGSWDVIVFDPPHLPNAAGSVNSSGIWLDRYGLTGDGRPGDNVIPMFAPFLLEAKRLLTPSGIILAKIADLVHNHRYQWQQVAFVNACISVGLTPCDMLIKCDPNSGNLKSSKWQNQRHLRKAHSYWIVARKGKCERPS